MNDEQKRIINYRVWELTKQKLELELKVHNMSVQNQNTIYFENTKAQGTVEDAIIRFKKQIKDLDKKIETLNEGIIKAPLSAN